MTSKNFNPIGNSRIDDIFKPLMRINICILIYLLKNSRRGLLEHGRGKEIGIWGEKDDSAVADVPPPHPCF